MVYAQDTAPSDTRDGVLWVDTSEASRPVYVYSSDTGQWEPTAPGNVTVSDTAPTGKAEGHLWIDTVPTPPVAKTLRADGTWAPDGSSVVPATLGDMTFYHIQEVVSGTYSLLDVTGSGVLTGGAMHGPSAGSDGSVTMTVDGTAVTYSTYRFTEYGGDRVVGAYLQPVQFDNSLKVEVTFPANGNGAIAGVRQ